MYSSNTAVERGGPEIASSESGLAAARKSIFPSSVLSVFPTFCPAAFPINEVTDQSVAGAIARRQQGFLFLLNFFCLVFFLLQAQEEDPRSCSRQEDPRMLLGSMRKATTSRDIFAAW